MVEQIEGQILNIRFASEDTHFVVATLRRDGHLQGIALVGVLPGLAQGMRVRCEGQWDQNPKFGRQFRAESYMETGRPPQRVSAICRAALYRASARKWLNELSRFGMRPLM